MLVSHSAGADADWLVWTLVVINLLIQTRQIRDVM